jgi:hypothetical protein
MTDAAHNQHSETRRPSDRDRIVTTGPSRFQPARPEVLPEMMSVSVAGIPKNRCRTMIAERMVETRAELPFIGDQIVCLSHDHAARSATRQKMGDIKRHRVIAGCDRLRTPKPHGHVGRAHETRIVRNWREPIGDIVTAG